MSLFPLVLMLSKAKSILFPHAIGFRTKCAQEGLFVDPFFAYTSGRWLCNNDAQLKARYAAFNIDGLKDIASETIGSPVQSMTKIAESLNRIFLLTHQNGTQTIARIPTPICGPPFFTTSSEVATMDLLRRLGVPVPKVLAWSSRAHATRVESEFIIMEKVDGEPLSEMGWNKIDHEDFAIKLANMVRPLVNLNFNCYGSLYYKHDLEGVQRNRILDDFIVDAPKGVDVSPFCIGPIARRDFWEDERASILDMTGPWTSPLEYLADVASREQIWIDKFAKPHLLDDFLCGLPLQGKQDDHIEMLEYYKYLLPFILPQEPQYLHGHLWHPDLHSGNLFVVKESMNDDGKVHVNITSCIDWQGAFIGPAFLQLTAPTMYQSEGAPLDALVLPPHLDTLDDANKKEVLLLNDEALRKQQFESLAFGDLMIDDAHIPTLVQRQELDDLAHCTWRTGLLPFRDALVKFCQRFSEIAPGKKCPIAFTADQLSAHAAAHAYWSMHRARAEDMEKEFGLDEYGYVAGDDISRFMSIQKKVEKRMREWVAEGKTEHGKLVKTYLWPYRETLDDHPRTHLVLESEVPSTTSTNPS
ncbi:hypothetical protein BDN70DRAFT_914917 [Pholiota conissans]|uniref:Aminoglycoside phosphotransferase domain-containing protein n=1 Tax=Pholiota conissans TaxID=109636 RepID=A0A9P5YX77_9AGAR|nr:hypothetical protein BDN70DRAFT_914917 [Pholiota conissans]